MEKIAMKCTRAEYESIKEFVGELVEKSDKDFHEYNYLHTWKDNTVFMYIKNGSCRVYETFDKDVFLKACGIKVKKDKRKKMFKKTIKLLKSFNELNFNINAIDTEYGYCRDAEGEHERDGSCTITIKVNKTK
jgi:phosphopentomutase